MTGFSLPTEQKEQKQNTVDQDQLREFTAGAATHSTGDPSPWEKHDPNERPTINVSIRLNSYELEILRYLSAAADLSQSKMLRRKVVPAMIEEIERKGQ